VIDEYRGLLKERRWGAATLLTADWIGIQIASYDFTKQDWLPQLAIALTEALALAPIHSDHNPWKELIRGITLI
jgi:hypothetical protein